MRKYFITVKNANTQWEEEMDYMFVTKDSPHFDTHVEGMHNHIPKNLTFEQVQHYANNLIDHFNQTLRPGESTRELICCRIGESE